MVGEFEKAAFEGQKGKVVGPVKTQFGWHLIRILDQR
jgi:peptidyl-prolyl cis-trans isomerase C